MLKYGLEGYGLYFYCLELIARTVEKHNLTFELEHDSELIARRVGIHHERVQEMMRYMVELKLFENDRGVITCLKMATRTDEYTAKLIKESRTLPTLSRQTPDTVPTMSDLKEEKRREERGKQTSRKPFPTTVAEIEAEAKRMGYVVDAQKMFDYYTHSNWCKANGKKVKSWTQCIVQWGTKIKKQTPETAMHDTGVSKGAI